MKLSKSYSTASDSDSSDDEEAARLAQAVDPDFLQSPAEVKVKQSQNKRQQDRPTAEDDLVSKRPKRSEEEILFSRPYSLEITVDGQKFIAKKLTEALDKKIKEVSPVPLPPPSPTSTLPDFGIRLFSNSDVLRATDLIEKRTTRPNQRQKKKRKKSKHSGSSSDSDIDTEKLRAVAVSADWVLNSNH